MARVYVLRPYQQVATNAANQSRVYFPPQAVAGVAQSLATEVSTDDLLRLKGIFEEARRTAASGEEVVMSVEKDVPSASFLTPWLKDGGTSLAAWLAVLLMILQMLISLSQQQATITPEQVQDIVTQVVTELERERAPEPPTKEKDLHKRP